MSSTDSHPLSEQQIIERIAAVFCPSSMESVLLGIGDDAAVLDSSHRSASLDLAQTVNQLVTTDLLIEGIHFSRQYMSMADVGYKALAVNLSDIAAMGGIPVHAFGVLGVPRTANTSEIDDLLDGISRLADETGVVLAGGDTVASPFWTIGFTILGQVEGSGLTRCGANPGEVIWHSGELGLSSAGLAMLTAGNANTTDPATSAHCRPSPQIELGRFLLQNNLATSCMDLSDSLSQCLLQLASASNVGLAVDLTEYAFNPLLRTPPQPDSLAATLLASAEDYQLLFTAPESATDKLISGSPVKLSRLGRTATPERGRLFVDESGRSLTIEPAGFTHF